MKVSIVMSFWNRKKQLFNTLRSIHSYGHEVEIIIVDDASTNGDDIHCFEDSLTKVITLTDKTWINPCIGFNTGFSQATGDIIIIQNAECYHHGDIVAHALSNARKGKYISYSAFCLNEELSNKITFDTDIDKMIRPYRHNKIDTEGWEGNGWYNHPVYRPEGYHFCAAIMREDLYDLGGFDERYYDGLGFDDNELLNRITKKGMKIKIIEEPFVLHQFHPKFQPGDVTSLMAINGIKWDETKRSPSYDVKPYNKIYK